MLFIGINVTVNIIDFFIINWYTSIFIFVFSCVYADFYRFIAIKAYKKFIELENKNDK